MATYKIEPAGMYRWRAIDENRNTIKTFNTEQAAQEWLKLAQPKGKN